MAPETDYLPHRMLQRSIVMIGLLLLLLPCSCESPSRREAIEQVSSHTEPIAHVKHSAHLRVVMREINELSLTRLPQEMGTSLSERRRIASIGAIAERLSASTKELPKYADELDLTPEQHASFIELAGYLGEEANELGQIARAGAQPSVVREKLREMVTTCNACHHLFRDPAAGTLIAPGG